MRKGYPVSLNRGFTLIELMITVAILAILLGVAVPAYQNYVVRAKVAECMHLVSIPKLAVSETVMTTGNLPDTNEQAGYFSVETNYCASVDIGADGVITAVTRNTGAGTEPVIQWVPAIQENGGQGIRWRCELADGSFSHVPASCRQNPE